MTEIIESSDALWGARDRDFHPKKPRATFHLLITGQLPSREVGRQWVSTKRELLGLLEAPTRE